MFLTRCPEVDSMSARITSKTSANRNLHDQLNVLRVSLSNSLLLGIREISNHRDFKNVQVNSNADAVDPVEHVGFVGGLAEILGVVQRVNPEHILALLVVVHNGAQGRPNVHELRCKLFVLKQYVK